MLALIHKALLQQQPSVHSTQEDSLCLRHKSLLGRLLANDHRLSYVEVQAIQCSCRLLQIDG